MKNNPLASLFGALWHYSAGNQKTVVLFWFMFVLNEAVNIVVQPLLTAKILNSIQVHQGVTEANLFTLFGYLGLMLCATIFFWSLHGPGRILERTNTFKARIEYRKFLLSGVMALPLEWHAEHHSGDTIDKIKEGTGALFDFGGGTFNILYSLTRLLVCFGILAYHSHLAVLVALLMMMVSAWITMRFDRILIPQYRELSHAENKISESVVDATSNISTVIILRVEKVVFNAIVKKLEKPYGLFVTNVKLSECKWFLTSVCCRVMICLSLAVYFWQQSRSHGVFEIGVYYLILSYLERVSDLFSRFCDIYGDIVIRRTRVMNSEELSKDFKTTSLANHVLPKNWQKLEIKNLSFSYHGEEGDMHLDNISLSLKPGEKIAFVGESGSGKTTFLKLIRDLYRPQRLSLLVDGTVIPDGFEGISRAIALVPQNPEIFKNTILWNIGLGADYDPTLITRFTDMACFSSVVATLPKGLESSIKEKGVNLSGGQQQRLALARGLLACHDKDIVLLDEPTSSLDTTTEMRAYQNIFEGLDGKTIISSIHRLHLLPLFDTIYLFDKGKIIGRGNLKELLRTCPEFQKRWSEYSKYQEV
ncbi:MAG: ABC transporter ATP-binding protein [Minisyncoccota bacterium]